MSLIYKFTSNTYEPPSNRISLLNQDDPKFRPSYIVQKESLISEQMESLLYSSSIEIEKKCQNENCKKDLVEVDILFGFARDFDRYTCKCKNCGFDFIPRININRENENSEIMTLLSPIILKKEIINLIENKSEDIFFKPEFYLLHRVIFWNLVYYFKIIKLPRFMLELKYSKEKENSFIQKLTIPRNYLNYEQFKLNQEAQEKSSLKVNGFSNTPESLGKSTYYKQNYKYSELKNNSRLKNDNIILETERDNSEQKCKMYEKFTNLFEDALKQNTQIKSDRIKTSNFQDKTFNKNHDKISSSAVKNLNPILRKGCLYQMNKENLQNLNCEIFVTPFKSKIGFQIKENEEEKINFPSSSIK